MTSKTALYKHYSTSGTLLYVGISLSPVQRLSEHADTAPWFEQIAKVEIRWFDDKASALIAEKEAIRAEKPLFNIRHVRRRKYPIMAGLEGDGEPFVYLTPQMMAVLKGPKKAKKEMLADVEDVFSMIQKKGYLQSV